MKSVKRAMQRVGIKADTPRDEVPGHGVIHCEMVQAEGRKDAFDFALEWECDLETLALKIADIEGLISDPRFRDGPMKPGAAPRIYQDAYLGGLREAREIVVMASAAPRSQ